MENSESKEKKIPMPDLVLLVQNHPLCYKSRNLNYAGEAEEMAFKRYGKNVSFADLGLRKTLTSSRTQKILSKISEAINWGPVEEILLRTYRVGKSHFGNHAYPPIMLLRAVLLQKWFGIHSDPELENQINDRLFFKTFIGLPLEDLSPDHSIISRFRDRVGKEALEKIHQEILEQFKRMGFSIEAGMAVDARLVRSASRPVSGKKLEALKEERKKSEEDETGKPAKFQRDVESDWTVKNDKPHFGMKEHAGVDVKSGLVLSSIISKASEHDTNYLQAVVVKGIHGDSLPPRVFADKGYHGAPNRKFLSRNGISDGIMRKDEVNAKLTEKETRRNRRISKVRYIVGQYFGLTALHSWSGRARFTTLAKEGWDRLLGAVAFNLKRAILKHRTALAA
jgi:IS5 family transposase